MRPRTRDLGIAIGSLPPDLHYTIAACPVFLSGTPQNYIMSQNVTTVAFSILM